MGSVLLAALLALPALASVPPQVAVPPQAPPPGTVNYVEGQASVDGQLMNAKSIGMPLGAGQMISTQNGRVEMLLTPGIFYRLAPNSAAQMVSPAMANTALLLERGRSLMEVAELHKENNLRVNMGPASTQMLKPGLYDFDANAGRVRVFDGEALVQVNGQDIKVKSGHELDLRNRGKLKTHGFDQKAHQDDFYRWASLRSSYMAQANADAARRYASGGVMAAGGPWYGAGWYWDPWFDSYAFIPGDGIFYSPFGWGFYSPWLASGAPYFGYGYHHFGPGYHSPYGMGHIQAGVAGHASGFSGRGFGNSGFHGGTSGFRAGGFGGGAHSGGFHGGGGGHGR